MKVGGRRRRVVEGKEGANEAKEGADGERKGETRGQHVVASTVRAKKSHAQVLESVLEALPVS